MFFFFLFNRNLFICYYCFIQIPKQLSSLYCELVSANPASRPNPADVITRCRRQGGYFKNDLVDVLLFLEEIQIKDRTEKSR